MSNEAVIDGVALAAEPYLVAGMIIGGTKDDAGYNQSQPVRSPHAPEGENFLREDPVRIERPGG